MQRHCVPFDCSFTFVIMKITYTSASPALVIKSSFLYRSGCNHRTVFTAVVCCPAASVLVLALLNRMQPASSLYISQADICFSVLLFRSVRLPCSKRCVGRQYKYQLYCAFCSAPRLPEYSSQVVSTCSAVFSAERIPIILQAFIFSTFSLGTFLFRQLLLKRFYFFFSKLSEKFLHHLLLFC